jgi:diamine N-acetyltransferase
MKFTQNSLGLEFSLSLAHLDDMKPLSIFSTEIFYDTFRGTCPDDDLMRFCEVTYSASVLEIEFSNPNSFIWLLKKLHRIVAYIKINFEAPVPFPMTGTGMEIQRLYVATEFHGLGLGKKLMNLAENEALEKGVERVWLGVYEHNENAKRFYELLGYTFFGSHPFPIGKTEQTDLWMMKNLRPWKQ